MISPLEEAALKAMEAQEAGRRAEMAKAWAAYSGDLPNPLKVTPGGPNDNVKVNRVRPIVEASVSLLFDEMPGWEIPKSADGEESPKKSPAEIFLEDTLEYNTFEARLLDFAINGAVFGTPYWRVVPGKPFPKLQVVDPTCMSIRWNPRDIDEVTAYIWQYNTIDEKNKPIIVQQVCEREGDHWRIIDRHANIEAAKYNQWVIDAETEWTYSWPPYLHCKNLPAPNEVYGQPDFGEIIIGLNKALNFNLSNRRKIDRLHGHPRVWVSGMQGQAVDMAPDKVTALDAPGAAIGQLTPSVNSENGAGLAREYGQDIETESATPALLLGRDDGSAIPASGTALRVRMRSALTKLNNKRKLYGPMLVELYRRILELGGFGGEIRVKLTWPEPLPVDSLVERQTLLIDTQLGASEETVLTKAGYDYAQERKRKEQETADMGEKVLNDFTNAPGANMQPGQADKPIDRPNGVAGI